MWRTVIDPFDRSVAYFGDQVALIEGDRSLTYRELGAHANQVANGLIELGVRPGDRVGLFMPNCLEFLPTLYGLWKAGASLTQMSSRSGPADVDHFLRSVDARTLIYHGALDEVVEKALPDLPALDHVIRLGEASSNATSTDYHDAFDGQPTHRPRVEIQPTDPAVVGYTGGTTGLPKAVVIEHAAWAHYHITAGFELGDIRDGEVFAHVAPLSHFTLSFVLPTLMRGGTNVIIPTFAPAPFLEEVARRGVTGTALVPTIIYMLLDTPELATTDLSTLRTMVYAASPMVPERLREGLERLGPIFSQGYAGTEPGYMTALRKPDHRLDSDKAIGRLASAGRPLYHVDISIRGDAGALSAGEIGEICARSPGQMKRYWQSELHDDVMVDGWVRSGDIGFVDDEGYVFIVDRKKDMIVSGGLNVFPRQVEDILAKHPAVAQSAVIGVPDNKWGEAVTAFVVRRPGQDVDEQTLTTMVKEAKGSVWAPKSVTFVDSIPVTAIGKPDKKALRRPYWEGQQRGVN